jgi:hypothetical protein
MKHIIILGEEYWFEKLGTKFTEANTLLQYLERHKISKYEYTIIKSPAQIITTVNTIGITNIKAIFLFQDILSDSNLNNRTIMEMKKFVTDLVNNDIFVYPPLNIIDTFASKNYNKTLELKLQWAALPKTQVLTFPNYLPSDENKIMTKLWYTIQDMWKIFDKVVVKKGYSYEGKQVKTFVKDKYKDFYEFREVAKKINYKSFWGQGTNSILIDKGVTRYYILQGYNKIVTKRQNEYRIFFHNGNPKYIANGDDIDNTCLVDRNNEPLLKEVILFAKKLYKHYIPLIWTLPRNPILFRIDVSYAVDPEFQDEHSIKVEGFDTPVRIYANEMEIDPTSFFYNKFSCKGIDNFTSKTIQRNIAKYIHKYIKSLK